LASIDTSRLEAFAEAVQSRILKGRQFHCLITGDKESQELNKRFRRKNYPTDVLSFPRPNGEGGDLAISLARARAQARQFGHAVEDELCILILHGALHLAGMDHETDDGEMARAEARWRKKLGLPAGLIARAAQ
jgi:probable rRNA maturation factor